MCGNSECGSRWMGKETVGSIGNQDRCTMTLRIIFVLKTQMAPTYTWKIILCHIDSKNNLHVLQVYETISLQGVDREVLT
jgi:hypothetical protein